MTAAVRGLALAALLGACANAGNGRDGNGIDAPPRPDAGVPADAPRVIVDAPPVVVDAPTVVVDAPPVVVDAPPSLFCSGNSQCTASGECCIDLGGPMGFCGPGVVIFGECVPQ